MARPAGKHNLPPSMAKQRPAQPLEPLSCVPSLVVSDPTWSEDSLFYFSAYTQGLAPQGLRHKMPGKLVQAEPLVLLLSASFRVSPSEPRRDQGRQGQWTCATPTGPQAGSAPGLEGQAGGPYQQLVSTGLYVYRMRPRHPHPQNSNNPVAQCRMIPISQI